MVSKRSSRAGRVVEARLEQAADQKASKEIEAVLTPAQKTKLPGVLKQLEAARGAGIPLEVVSDLKLAPDQWKKLEVISKEATAKRQQMMQGAAAGGGQGLR